MDAFLSYNRADAAAVNTLDTWLASHGLRCFLDTRELSSGGAWLPELERAITREASAMLVLVGPAGLGNTQHYEYQLGLTRQADLDDISGWLERHLAVTQTLGAVTWTIALSHPDREAALDALRRLHAFAEAKVRADLEQMASRRVAALEGRLAREPDLYIRQSLYELLAASQRAGVVAMADEAVAARLVSAPSVPLRPTLPNRPLLLLLLLVAAPMAALAVVAAGVLRGARHGVERGR